MKEEGKLDEVFQVERHRGKEDAVAKCAQEGGQPQAFLIEHRRDVEIHQYLIGEQTGKTHGEQSRVLETQTGEWPPFWRLFAPQDGKCTTTDIAQYLEQRELRRGGESPTENSASESVLQHLRCSVHHLGNKKHAQDRI